MISVRTIRLGLVAVCAAGIVGMIVTSAGGSNDGALAFGLVTAAAAVGLILVTAVTSRPPPEAEEALALQVEQRVVELVAAGADEAEVRHLVGVAARLGRLRSGS